MVKAGMKLASLLLSTSVVVGCGGGSESGESPPPPPPPPALDPVEVDRKGPSPLVTTGKRVEVSGRVRPASASLSIDFRPVTVSQDGKFSAFVRARRRPGSKRTVLLVAEAVGYETTEISMVVERSLTPEQIAAAEARAAARKAERDRKRAAAKEKRAAAKEKRESKVESEYERNFEIAREICSEFSPRKVAAEFGAPPGASNFEIAEAYAREVVVPELRAATVDGCVAGFSE